MLNDLAGKRILITGASSGIGGALIPAFAKAGARLCLQGHNHIDQAEKLARSLRQSGQDARALHADVAREEQVHALITQAAEPWEGLDVMILNAGGLVQPATLADFDSTRYQQVMDLNLSSVLWSMQAALPWMAEGSAIIATASIAARTGGSPGSLLYGAAKAAVLAVTRNAARDLAPRGIRVNAVGPGFIETPFHAQTPDAHRTAARAAIPMGRLGTPEDCVGAYLFLASNTLSGYVTGQMIDVNGGLLMA
ncbi:MAG: SDR family NAD(P)-dependent oxidoreductase [Qingshengfaniella sp.]